MTDRPTVVVGFDGAGFELVEPWIGGRPSPEPGTGRR